MPRRDDVDGDFRISVLESDKVVRGWTVSDDKFVWEHVDGRYMLDHRCVRDYGIVLCSSNLTAHECNVVNDLLTVSPSILCGNCGMHGFLTEGVWRDC